MIPCCKEVYKKYLMKDGKLDYSKCFGLRVYFKIIENQNISQESKQYYIDDILNKVCYCDCHKIKNDCRH